MFPAKKAFSPHSFFKNLQHKYLILKMLDSGGLRVYNKFDKNIGAAVGKSPCKFCFDDHKQSVKSFEGILRETFFKGSP